MSNARNLANLLGTSTTVPTSKQPAGSVLQVVQATNQTQTSIAGAATQGAANYTDIVSATITPSSSSSKILAIGKVTMGADSISKDFQLFLKRNSTLVGGNTDSSFLGSNYMCSGSPSAQEAGNTFNFTYLDSPSTTSAATYTIQFNGSENSSTYYLNRGTATPGSYHYRSGADSSIILMEIAG
jgi:hypothetical protein|tara:strand:- start:15 stop:566 length:552 start_codon:yes stop_codon:yes gene_type:complete